MLILTTENAGKLPIPGIAGVMRIGTEGNAERKFKRTMASCAALLLSSVVVAKEYVVLLAIVARMVYGPLA